MSGMGRRPLPQPLLLPPHGYSADESLSSTCCRTASAGVAHCRNQQALSCQVDPEEVALAHHWGTLIGGEGGGNGMEVQPRQLWRLQPRAVLPRACAAVPPCTRARHLSAVTRQATSHSASLHCRSPVCPLRSSFWRYRRHSCCTKRRSPGSSGTHSNRSTPASSNLRCPEGQRSAHCTRLSRDVRDKQARPGSSIASDPRSAQQCGTYCCRQVQLQHPSLTSAGAGGGCAAGSCPSLQGVRRR